MFFHESLSDSKSTQGSRTFLNILADLASAVVWMVSTRILIFYSSSLFTKPLVYYFYYYSFKGFSYQLTLGMKNRQTPRSFSVFIIIVWIVSTCPFISKSSSPIIHPLVTVPSAPITIGIIVTFMFHWFFSSLTRSKFLFTFSFTQWSAGIAKSTVLLVLFFCWLSHGQVV